METTTAQGDIGLIGLSVTGQNFVLRMHEHGDVVVIYNRPGAEGEAFLAAVTRGTTIQSAATMEEFVAKLKRPRRVMLLVEAGPAVDILIAELIPHLSPGDIIIDAGDSFFEDTARRQRALEPRGFFFIGVGIAGGQEALRQGPSLMPGGAAAAWPQVKEILQSLSAKREDGTPCCEWIGAEGAGHYVQMVHKAITYADMQLLAEAYHILKSGLRLSAPELHAVFAEWNTGALACPLLAITRDLFAKSDADGTLLLEKMLDTSGQKETCKGILASALELRVPTPVFAEVLYADCVAGLKEERIKSSRKLKGPNPLFLSGRNLKRRDALIAQVRDALYASKIVSYAQGFMLLRTAASAYAWPLDLAGIARLWSAGSPLQSGFLGKVQDALEKKPGLKSLLHNHALRDEIKTCQKGWRNIVATAAKRGIPVPTIGCALAFYDSYRARLLPTNLLLAQQNAIATPSRGPFPSPDRAETGEPAGDPTHTF